MHQQASFLLPVIETNGASKEKKRKEKKIINSQKLNSF
jgi:hypothetical protein